MRWPERERETQHGNRAELSRGTTRHAGAERPPADDEWKAGQLVLAKALDDCAPVGVEAGNGRWRTPPRDAVWLLDERNGDLLLERNVPSGHEVGSLDATTGAVAEDERCAWPVDSVEVHAGGPARRLDLECGGGWHSASLEPARAAPPGAALVSRGYAVVAASDFT